MVKDLIKTGVKIQAPKKVETKLQGKTFVFTGALKTTTREEASEKVRLLGGKVSWSVSRNTDFVVVGENPGSKYEKVKKLGVKTITEEEFLKMIAD